MRALRARNIKGFLRATGARKPTISPLLSQAEIGAGEERGDSTEVVVAAVVFVQLASVQGLRGSTLHL